MSTVILMTGTIDPRGMRLTARSDVGVRLRDYESALRLWATTTNLPIIFCENSGTDLAPLRSALAGLADKIEWLGFLAPTFPEHLGKGFGETLIIQHALQNSRWIGPDSLIIKITGRLFINNFSKIEKDIVENPGDVICDLDPFTLNYSDSRFFASSVRFLENYLLLETQGMNEIDKPIINLERVLARAILKAVAAGYSWRQLPTSPYYVGYSGTTGRQYRNRSFFIKILSRSIFNLLGPFWAPSNAAFETSSKSSATAIGSSNESIGAASDRHRRH